jgi:hypothetical protein
MFYQGDSINLLKKQSELALHNATQLSKGVYPTPDQFISRCRYSFVRNIAAPTLIKLCGEQLIIDLNECNYEEMITLVSDYLYDYGAKDICAVTVLDDILQAALPVA